MYYTYRRRDVSCATHQHFRCLFVHRSLHKSRRWYMEIQIRRPRRMYVSGPRGRPLTRKDPTTTEASAPTAYRFHSTGDDKWHKRSHQFPHVCTCLRDHALRRCTLELSWGSFGGPWNRYRMGSLDPPSQGTLVAPGADSWRVSDSHTSVMNQQVRTTTFDWRKGA